MKTNRIVALLTPLFALGSGIAAGWLAKNFPGLPVPSAGDITAIEITVATSASAAALKWLHGWQVFEDAERWLKQSHVITASLDGQAIAAAMPRTAVLPDNETEPTQTQVVVSEDAPIDNSSGQTQVVTSEDAPAPTTPAGQTQQG